MSKVFDAVSRAQRERDANYGRRDSNNDGHGPDDGARGWLRHRLLDWLPARRPAAVIEPRPVLPPLEIDLDATSSGDELSAILEERFASLQVAVDALDDRISSEIVEREAKFLEEIGHGMRGLEIELLHRLSASTLAMKRSIQLSTALVLAGGLLFAGVSIGVLLKF